MKVFKDLYKRASDGKVQFWRQELHPAKDGRYRTVTGKVGGKDVPSEWKQAKAKNTGRSNARTALQQAESEIEAHYTQRRDWKYHDSIDTIDTAKGFQCMLAAKYEDQNNLDFSRLFSQPKLDGMRCIGTVENKLMSRDNNQIVSVPHIWQALQPLFRLYPNVRIDGELYNHEFKADFNSIISSCRRTKDLGPETLARSKEVIQYHIYDFADPEHSFYERFVKRVHRLHNLFPANSPIKFVRTDLVTSEAALDALFEEYLDDEYEGQMVRFDVPYKGKRTRSLLKRKIDETEEFILIDVKSGVGNWAGKAKSALVKLPSGKTSSVGIRGEAEHLAMVLKQKHKYIGKPTTVRFQGYTPDGRLRFGRVKQFDRWG